MSDNTETTLTVRDVLESLFEGFFNDIKIHEKVLNYLSEVEANNSSIQEELERMQSKIEILLADESSEPSEIFQYEYALSVVDDAYQRLCDDFDNPDAWQKLELDESDYADDLD